MCFPPPGSGGRKYGTVVVHLIIADATLNWTRIPETCEPVDQLMSYPQAIIRTKMRFMFWVRVISRY